MILTAKTNLDERYTPEERENIVELLNTKEVPATLGASRNNDQPFGVDMERVVGTIVAGSAHIVEDGQIGYDIDIMENLPLSKILTTMVENMPEWNPGYSLSMKGMFDGAPKVEEIICVDVTAGQKYEKT